MRRRKVMLVSGTRPEAIKMCPLVNELKSRPEELSTVVCVTGQHREMLDQVLDVFDVVPDYDLHVMRSEQTLFDITCDVLLGIRSVLEEERPDAILEMRDKCAVKFSEQFILRFQAFGFQGGLTPLL